MSIEWSEYILGKTIGTPVDGDIIPYITEAGQVKFADATGLGGGSSSSLQSWPIYCGDRVTPIVTANNIMSWPVPFDMSVAEVQAYVTDPAVSGTFTVRLKINGVSVLSTNITIDAGEQNSVTAATPPVISNASWEKGDELTIDVTDDADGSVTGLVVTVVAGATVDNEAPTTPGTPSFSAVGSDSMTVSWTASSDNVGVTAYLLQRATNNLFTTGVVNTTLGNVLSTNVTGLTPETTYYFRVRARDAAGNISEYSAIASQATGEEITIDSLSADIIRWYKPEGFVGLSNNDNIVTWPDSSNENVDMTGSAGDDGPLYQTNIVNGLAAALCAVAGVSNANTKYFGTMGDLSALTAGEAFLVIKPTSENPGAGGGNGLWQLGASNSVYPLASDGHIYDSFGRATSVDAGDPGIDLSAAWHIYSVYSAPGDWANFLDGVELFQTNSNTVAFPSSGTQLGRCGSVFLNMDGHIAEFILFNRKLTTEERAAVVAELQEKYGL